MPIGSDYLLPLMPICLENMAQNIYCHMVGDRQYPDNAAEIYSSVTPPATTLKLPTSQAKAIPPTHVNHE